MPGEARTRGRPSKYATEEERKEAIKAYKREYYRKHRAQSEPAEPKKRGRPVKYHTEEERLEAKRKRNREYMARKRAQIHNEKSVASTSEECDEEALLSQCSEQ